MLSPLFFCCCIKWTNAKSINFNHHADSACHAKSVQIIQILKKVWKCVQNRLLLKFVQKNSPAKQRMPWALATTATTMTMTMIRATMTIAMTGPLPASGKWNVSKKFFVVGKCVASSWLSGGKLVTKQTDYQTEALHQVQSCAVTRANIRKESFKRRIIRVRTLAFFGLISASISPQGYFEGV